MYNYFLRFFSQFGKCKYNIFFLRMCSQEISVYLQLK